MVNPIQVRHYGPFQVISPASYFSEYVSAALTTNTIIFRTLKRSIHISQFIIHNYSLGVPPASAEKATAAVGLCRTTHSLRPYRASHYRV